NGRPLRGTGAGTLAAECIRHQVRRLTPIRRAARSARASSGDGPSGVEGTTLLRIAAPLPRRAALAEPDGDAQALQFLLRLGGGFEVATLGGAFQDQEPVDG